MKKTKFLHLAETRIENTMKDETITNALSKFGYTPERMLEGKEILTTAKEVNLKWSNENAAVEVAYNTRNKKRNESDFQFKTLRTVAKLAFKNDLSATLSLGLNAQIPKTISGWENYCSTFFTNLLQKEEWVSQMAVYSMTKEKIQEAEATFKETVELNQAVLLTKGDAQQTTLDRDHIFTKLEIWIADFDTIAKLALHDSPQLLEKLGIIVKS